MFFKKIQEFTIDSNPKDFFRPILAVKRCLSRARCAAQARVASVRYRGQASCRHRVLSFSVSPPLFLWSAAAFLRRQSGVFLHATASFFQSATSSFLSYFRPLDMQPLRMDFVTLGECACICSRGAFCHISSCTVMGLELGFYIRFLGSAFLSQFARFHGT